MKWENDTFALPAGRTMLGLSALPSNHPLNVGMLGMHGNYAHRSLPISWAPWKVKWM